MTLKRTTEDLIAAAQTGESEAQEELVQRHRDALDHHIRLRVGTHLRTRLEIEDVFQETFAKALQSLESFRWQGECSFLRWLKSIAENQILALAKKHGRDQVLLVEKPELPREDDSPAVLVRRGERFDRLRSALDRLDPEYREVIVLARLKGLRLREVAERMHRSPNAVAHLLSRALTQLKETFGDTESFSLPARRLDETEQGGQDRGV